MNNPPRIRPERKTDLAVRKLARALILLARKQLEQQRNAAPPAQDQSGDDG